MKRLLAISLAAVAAAAISATPASAKDVCSLTAMTPKILSPGEIRSAGWARCRRTVRRGVDMANVLELTSGKKLELNGSGFFGRFRAGERNGWGASASVPCAMITHERHQRRYGDDLPVNYIVRITLITRSGKELKRKDSRAVPIEELCPGSQAEGSPPPAPR